MNKYPFYCPNCKEKTEHLNLICQVCKPTKTHESLMKVEPSLIPHEIITALAEVLTYGKRKYSKDGWKQCKREDLDRYWNAMLRHLVAHQSGQKIDPESKLPHLDHALTNLAFLIWFEKNPPNNENS